MSFQIIEEESPTCQKCGSKEIRKSSSSIDYEKRTKKQGYNCNRCGTHFSAGVWNKLHSSKEQIDYVLMLYSQGMSSSEVAINFETKFREKINYKTVLYWVAKIRPDLRTGKRQISIEGRELNALKISVAIKRYWAEPRSEKHRETISKRLSLLNKNWWAKHPRPKISGSCFRCGIDFIQKRRHSKPQKFCSNRCNALYQSNKMKGKHGKIRVVGIRMTRIPWRAFWSNIEKEMGIHKRTHCSNGHIRC